MKKNLPYLFISAWFLTSAIFGLAKAVSPNLLGGVWPERVGVVMGGVLLSLAILFGIASAMQGEHRRRNAAAIAIAVVLHIGWTGFYLFGSTTEAEVATELGASFKSGLTLERLTERALNSPVLRGRELAASFAFREFGERVPYADESGNVRTFEPTSVDLTKRESNRQLQVRMTDTQKVLRHQARGFRWAAFAYLLSLAGVLIGGAIVLGGPRAWHRWLTRR
jgi:hypothetical protein